MSKKKETKPSEEVIQMMKVDAALTREAAEQHIREREERLEWARKQDEPRTE